MTDISDKDFWDQKWQKNRFKELPEKKYINKRTLQLFSKYIRKGDAVIEIGCANSQWLPFLRQNFDIDIAGVDYSEQGVTNLQYLLRGKNIPGDIYLSDFRVVSEALYGKFDLLFSFGVIEHFTDYPEVLRNFSQFLKKDGIIITLIPNFASPFYGRIQQKISREIFEKHVIIDREKLAQAHSECYKILFCDYFGAFEPALFDYSDKKGIGHLFFDVLIGFSTRVMAPMLNIFHIGDHSKILSSHTVCVGKKYAI